jgi:uncharacterized protein
MKKSRFNIIRNIDGEKSIIFNSFSLAMAEVDQTFFKIYENLDKIEAAKLNKEEKETYDAMSNYQFIVDNETDEINNLKYLRLKSMSDAGSFSMVIFPTLSCNFDCYYCFEKNKEGVVSKEVQEKIIELIKGHAERKMDIQVVWFGGEPLLVYNIISEMTRKFIEICEQNKVKYTSSLVTNGYLFNDEMISNMKNWNLQNIQVTLDGPPELHNKRRFLIKSREGTFDRILENLKKLKKQGLPVRIRVNTNKDYDMKTLLDLVKILDESGLINDFYISQEFDSNSGVKSCLNENCLSNDEYAEFSFNFYKKLDELGYLKLNKESYYPSIRFNSCGATRFNTLNVDPSGYLYRCCEEVGMHERSIGNILSGKAGNENYYNNNNIKYLLWNPFDFKKCNECSLIPICAGSCPKHGIEENEPQCIDWKHNIEGLMDAIAAGNLKNSE